MRPPIRPLFAFDIWHSHTNTKKKRKSDVGFTSSRLPFAAAVAKKKIRKRTNSLWRKQQNIRFIVVVASGSARCPPCSLATTTMTKYWIQVLIKIVPYWVCVPIIWARRKRAHLWIVISGRNYFVWWFLVKLEIGKERKKSILSERLFKWLWSAM